MSDNADIVRDTLIQHACFPDDALAALDALVAERDEWASKAQEHLAGWNMATNRADAAEAENARLREALREIIEEFRKGIRAGEPQRYDERDPVVIIARAALGEDA